MLLNDYSKNIKEPENQWFYNQSLIIDNFWIFWKFPIPSMDVIIMIIHCAIHSIINCAQLCLPIFLSGTQLDVCVFLI